LKKKCCNIFEKYWNIFNEKLMRWAGGKIKNIHLDGIWWV
jgi:hypothetical protein